MKKQTYVDIMNSLTFLGIKFNAIEDTEVVDLHLDNGIWSKIDFILDSICQELDDKAALTASLFSEKLNYSYVILRDATTGNLFDIQTFDEAYDFINSVNYKEHIKEYNEQLWGVQEIHYEFE